MGARGKGAFALLKKLIKGNLSLEKGCFRLEANSGNFEFACGLFSFTMNVEQIV